ncbi:hypothetical protein HWB92_gp007 [Serratia phage vB_SmaA_3M]|uniref:Uncharacterized protein n=1 Tax=Serratia phage vB_SmaA_3M TaxID=2419930 RepID=A0A3G2YSI5_9CAUD|nr:hypothetical protein HWB92_gp007 [Serratia phage vB_SmaA_3M]AYP28265.1 hypothetical protein 3M_007c [Serratia phage vB_SmaA_3M]
MSFELTDNMTVLEMMVKYEVDQIERFHSKNTKDGNWPSDSEIEQEAKDRINDMTNVQLLEQMQFVLDERKEQRAKRTQQPQQ